MNHLGTGQNKISWILSILLALGLGLIAACDSPSDLEAVSGIQGEIQINGTIPDSIKAVALVILLPEAYNDQDNIGKHLVNYSDPLSATGEYYTQLKPGLYMGVIVGLLIDPGVFVANLDDYLANTDLPIVQLSEGLNSFLVEEYEMQMIDWSVNF
ncbi:MAG: hypothetical protein U9Q77_01500 [Candidatus Marinimicrobia bacterium]|nr:hypothetical protein [Candidatus Neomarinimicrobiota bacterium]